MIERAQFGNIGHESSRAIFGAAALGGMRQDKADGVLEVLLEFGVDHIDTAAAYGDSELRIAPWMRAHREQFFLASKTGARDAEGARKSLERSLQRLGSSQCRARVGRGLTAVKARGGALAAPTGDTD